MKLLNCSKTLDSIIWEPCPHLKHPTSAWGRAQLEVWGLVFAISWAVEVSTQPHLAPHCSLSVVIKMGQALLFCDRVFCEKKPNFVRFFKIYF